MTQNGFSIRRRWRAGRIVLRRALRRWTRRRAAVPALAVWTMSDSAGQPDRAVPGNPRDRETVLTAGPVPVVRSVPPRQIAWKLAAVTGTVGIILLLLMQISSLFSAKAAGETQRIAPMAALPDPEPENAELQFAHNAVPVPEHELPPWPAYEPEPEPEPVPEPIEPLLDVELGLDVARYTDDEEQFAVISPADGGFDPATLVAPVEENTGRDLWDAFNPNRAEPASGGRTRAAALAALLGGQSQPPLEPLEPETAPSEQAQFDVVIEKRVPATGVVFQPLEYEIVVRNTGRDDVPQITVDELLPESYEVEHTLPAARISGQSVSWQLRDISPGEVRTLHVRTIPTVAGESDAAAVVEAVAAVMAETRVAIPRVRLDVVAPEHSTVGRLTQFTFRVTNEGEVDAEDLVLRTDLPDVLSHPLGRELDYTIGTLMPGEIREMTLTAVAATPGEANQRTEIHSREESLASEVVNVSVETPGLVLRREGLKQPPVGEAVVFTNHVANTSDAALTGLEIVETVPEGFEVVSVGDEGEFHRETRTLRWRLEELEAGRTATLNVTLRTGRPGMLRSVVTVWSANHPEQTMHATVAARTVVPISAPTRRVYPRSPAASGWPMSSPSFSSWPLGGGFRSGCAP